MTTSDGWPERRVRWMNRLQARLSTRARPATGFTSQPEPRTIGSYARGRQLVAGNFLFAGFLIESPGVPIWDLPMPDTAFEEELHGFVWLDDLAAVGDPLARERAQNWTYAWIASYGRGRGPGWTPDLTARRLIRWINHALFLLNGRDRAASDAYFRSLAQQTIFLSRRWQAALPGLHRFEALTGLIYAGLALTGMERHVAPATAALARECQREITAEGGIPTRNPEELLEVFTLLNWATQALGEAGRMAPKDILAAIERIAPTLRSLRHADGGLARFHGGGRGAEGRLDHALASSGVKAQAAAGTLAMGYARLAAGRTSVIVDADEPPGGRASFAAHASTLAFELTSGRRPLVVSCGSGAPFGSEWRRAGRATPSHSVLAVEGFSSSRLGNGARLSGDQAREELTDRARIVDRNLWTDARGQGLMLAHDGFGRTHGLTYTRLLELTLDGRRLSGVERLAAVTPQQRKRFETVTAMEPAGVRCVTRFHLHPDVDAHVDLGGTAISLALKSGEIWIFRCDGRAQMALEPSVFLEKSRLKPRATKQIVLTGAILDYAGEISWTLAKAQDTPQAIRDLERDDPLTRI